MQSAIFENPQCYPKRQSVNAEPFQTMGFVACIQPQDTGPNRPLRHWTCFLAMQGPFHIAKCNALLCTQ